MSAASPIRSRASFGANGVLRGYRRAGISGHLNAGIRPIDRVAGTIPRRCTVTTRSASAERSLFLFRSDPECWPRASGCRRGSTMLRRFFPIPNAPIPLGAPGCSAHCALRAEQPLL